MANNHTRNQSTAKSILVTDDEVPPPPYEEETGLKNTPNNHIPAQTQEKETRSVVPAQEQNLALEETPEPAIPKGTWDLACGIGCEGSINLNSDAIPIWQNTAKTLRPGEGYLRDGFYVYLNATSITVTNKAYTWKPSAGEAERLLRSNQSSVSLTSIAGQLIVYERTIVKKDPRRPAPKPREDVKGCLQIRSDSHNVWSIRGTDIYQVDGYDNNIVVRTPMHLRLWNMAKRRFLWERPYTLTLICVTASYVVIGEYWWHIINCDSGLEHGQFMMPTSQAFNNLKEESHFGPVVSAKGVILQKSSDKALYIFSIHSDRVDIRVWESEERIEGCLVLRGSLAELELNIIGHSHVWTKHELKTEWVYKTNIIKAWVLSRG